MTSVLLDPLLLQAIQNLAGLSVGREVEWVVQERAYAGASNFARSYSEPGTIVWNDVFVPTPPNDRPKNATVVDATPFTDTVDTRFAGVGSGEPPLCGYADPLQATVWYIYTAPADVRVRANTYGSANPEAFGINVLQGSPGSWEVYACGYSEVDFFAVAGQTYYFDVGTLPWAQPGLLTFWLDAIVPPDIGVTVNPIGSFEKVSGAAVVSGTVTCNRPVEVSINGAVRQTVGRFHVIEGTFYQTVSCVDSAPWQAQAMSPAGSFGGGATSVQVSAWGYDPETGQYDSSDVTQTANLRGKSTQQGGKK